MSEVDDIYAAILQSHAANTAEAQKRRAYSDWLDQTEAARQQDAASPQGDLSAWDATKNIGGSLMETLDLLPHTVRSGLLKAQELASNAVVRSTLPDNFTSTQADDMMNSVAPHRGWQDLWRQTAFGSGLNNQFMHSMMMDRPQEDLPYGKDYNPYARAMLATGSASIDEIAAIFAPVPTPKMGLNALNRAGRAADPTLQAIRTNVARTSGLGGLQATLRMERGSGPLISELADTIHPGPQDAMFERQMGPQMPQRTPEQLNGLLDRMVQERSGQLNNAEMTAAEDARATYAMVSDAIDRSLAEGHADNIVAGIPGPRSMAPFVPSTSEPPIGLTGNLGIQGRLAADEARAAMLPNAGSVLPTPANLPAPGGDGAALSQALRDRLAEIGNMVDGPVGPHPAPDVAQIGSLSAEERAYIDSLGRGAEPTPLPLQGSTTPPPTVVQIGSLSEADRAYIDTLGKPGKAPVAPEPAVGETGGVPPSELPRAPVSTPVTAALDAGANGVMRNPLNNHEHLILNNEGGGAFIQISEKDGVIRLHSIRSATPGSGEGKFALEKLIKLADENGSEIHLNSKPFDVGKKGLSQKQLTDWYRRHGFRETGGGEMVRKPNALLPRPVSPDINWEEVVHPAGGKDTSLPEMPAYEPGTPDLPTPKAPAPIPAPEGGWRFPNAQHAIRTDKGVQNTLRPLINVPDSGKGVVSSSPGAVVFHGYGDTHVRVRHPGVPIDSAEIVQPIKETFHSAGKDLIVEHIPRLKPVESLVPPSGTPGDNPLVSAFADLEERLAAEGRALRPGALGSATPVEAAETLKKGKFLRTEPPAIGADDYGLNAFGVDENGQIKIVNPDVVVSVQEAERLARQERINENIKAFLKKGRENDAARIATSRPYVGTVPVPGQVPTTAPPEIASAAAGEAAAAAGQEREFWSGMRAAARAPVAAEDVAGPNTPALKSKAPALDPSQFKRVKPAPKMDNPAGRTLTPEEVERIKEINVFMNPNRDTEAPRMRGGLERGSAHVGLVAGGVAGAAAGAQAGAALDKDNPTRGALLGGVAGGVLGILVGGKASHPQVVDALGKDLKGTSAVRQSVVNKALDRVNSGLQWTAALGQTGAGKTVAALTKRISAFDKADAFFSTMTTRGAAFHEIIRAPEAAKEIGGDVFDSLARVASASAGELKAAGVTADDLAQLTYKREGSELFNQAAYDKVVKVSPRFVKAVETATDFADQMHDELLKLGILTPEQHAALKGKYLTRTYEEGVIKAFNTITGDVSGGERIALGATKPKSRLLPLSEAEEAGLETNPVKRIAMTLNRQAYLKGWGEAYSNLREMGRTGESPFHGTIPDYLAKAPKVWLSKDEAMAAFKDNPVMKAEWSHLHQGVYGRASGGYLRKDVLAAIADQHKTYTGYTGALRRLAQSANRAAAVFRVAVFPRDLVTNAGRSTMVGISVFNPGNASYYKRALQLLAADSPEANAALMTIGKETKTVAAWRRSFLGEQAINKSYLRKELNETLSEFNDPKQIDSVMGKFMSLYEKAGEPATAWNRAKNFATGSTAGLDQAKQFAMKMKVDVDNAFRAAHVIKAMEEGRSVRDATLHMMQYWTNPAFTSTFTNITRNFGGAGAILGQPGIAYNHDTWRILKNIATTRPEGLVYGAGAMFAASRTADALWGVDGKERDAINKEYGPAAMVLGRDERGQPMVMDPFKLDTGANVAGLLGLRGKANEGAGASRMLAARAIFNEAGLPVGGVMLRGMGNAAMAAMGQDQAPFTKLPLRQPWQTPGSAALDQAFRGLSPAGYGQFKDVSDAIAGDTDPSKTARRLVGFSSEQSPLDRRLTRTRAPGHLSRVLEQDLSNMEYRLGRGEMSSAAYSERIQQRLRAYRADLKAAVDALK